ncbi:SMI1/KNR4 family protein [Agrobacterium sp. LAD9]|uniref:SMI1/KNR4 family protein n=1 Tax=Agrobacterium sp. LAD9 TaxID=2055153 RepID=UPI001863CA33|nr:SMI1/KNR4 family protein [Agrobacterium sp. LAD9]
MEKAIRQFELQFALELPDHLREALLRDQIPNENVVFETEDRKVAGWITEFFPVKSDGSTSYASEYEQISLAQLLPRNLLPIAMVANYDRIVVSLSGADKGYIYYWAWSEEPDPESNSYQLPASHRCGLF